MENKKVIVYVDDNFHYMDTEYRYKEGEYDTIEKAIEVCKSITDDSMEDVYLPGIDAERLIDRYKSFGEDPWICSEQKGLRFSAWTYVQSEAQNFINKKQQYETNNKDTASN